MSPDLIERLSRSRARLALSLASGGAVRKGEEEGGCGVVGFCCSQPVSGRHIYEPSKQMHNRGNGKGGGIAAVGFVPEQLGVSRKVLDECTMLHVAYLDPAVQGQVEAKFITPHFDVSASATLDTVEDWHSVEGLEVKPPDVQRYFVRVKPGVLDAFIKENGLEGLDRREAEDEFVNQNGFRLNQEYYASLGDKKAFVLSNGRDIMILKVVGYAEAIVKYYRIEDLRAHVWIAHQRYPTKGRVWHPGGAHPFAGIDMALVHNGDFANYHSVSEYLKQRDIHPQFLTDTEVSALLFDLLHRTYHYPLEYIIEALAPTTELDFDRLPPAKQRVYRAIQATHMHGSPDGPWFFIIARSLPKQRQFQLMGITDTAMLRPQVFAFHDGEVQIALIGSEKQAIDATLLSLSQEDGRICPVADRYWNARGGSSSDGGAFLFNLVPGADGRYRIHCTDKFGAEVPMPRASEPCDWTQGTSLSADTEESMETVINERLVPGNSHAVFEMIRDELAEWSFDEFRLACRIVSEAAVKPRTTAVAIETLTLLNDRRYSTGSKKRSHLLHLLRGELERLFRGLPFVGALRADRQRLPPDRLCPAERPDPASAGLCSAGHRRRGICPRGRRLRRVAPLQGLSDGVETLHHLRLQGPAIHRMRPGARHGRRDDRRVRQLGRLPGLWDRRAVDRGPRQRPGPAWPDHQAGQARDPRGHGPDLHVRRQRRGGLRAG